MIDLQGVLLPAPTPFDPATGEVDVVALRRNVRAWLEAPIAGIVLAGSTGEAPMLDEDERVRMIEAAREPMEGRLLLAGAGAESTRAAIRMARAAADAGADAVLVYPPSFFRPFLGPDVLRDHFRAVADASPVPVVLYQVPTPFTGIELPAGLVGELARHENIVGIKDSSGDLKSIARFVEACGRSCSVLVGSGSVLYAGLELGAAGGVVAAAVIAPFETAALHQRWRENDPAAAGRLQERIQPVDRGIGRRFGVAGIKAALEMRGLVGGLPRPPLQPLPRKQMDEVRARLEEAGELHPLAR